MLLLLLAAEQGRALVAAGDSAPSTEKYLIGAISALAAAVVFLFLLQVKRSKDCESELKALREEMLKTYREVVATTNASIAAATQAIRDVGDRR